MHRVQQRAGPGPSRGAAGPHVRQAALASPRPVAYGQSTLRTLATPTYVIVWESS